MDFLLTCKVEISQVKKKCKTDLQYYIYIYIYIYTYCTYTISLSLGCNVFFFAVPPYTFFCRSLVVKCVHVLCICASILYIYTYIYILDARPAITIVLRESWSDTEFGGTGGTSFLTGKLKLLFNLSFALLQ